MLPMLLAAEHIYKDYGTKKLVEDGTVYLPERERIGIIGVNGTGKSTLLRILVGAESADAGIVSYARNARISFLTQEPDMDMGRAVLEQVFAEQSPQFREINEYEAKSMLTKLGIADFSQRIGELSGGQRKRTALAAALIRPADILILDEPTNHLDSEMTEWLEARLRSFSGGIVMVTHDRYFLERVVTRITELSKGKLYSYEANYSKYLELKAERCDMAAASERKRQAVLKREYEWISRGARARGTKSKERIDRYNELKDADAPDGDKRVEITAVSSRMGKKLISIEHITKSFGEKTVISDFSYTVGRGDRIGIVGRNGAGKSTLLNMIAGRLEPDSGNIDVGSTIRIGYFTQENRELDPDMRAYDLVREAASEVSTSEGVLSVSQIMEQFLFDSTMQYTPIGRLSGGERRRLYLLSILATAPNVLLLDEPTNDLDIDTLTVLEDYIASFRGAVIAVSHDRYFLDKTAEHIFEVGESGIVTRYTGGWSDYAEKRPVPAKYDTEAKPKQTRPVQEKQRKLKMTFKEEREYETIDADIAAIESRIAECETETQNVSSDYVRLIECNERMEALKAELEQKTERWIYLSELAERIAETKD